MSWYKQAVPAGLVAGAARSWAARLCWLHISLKLAGRSAAVGCIAPCRLAAACGCKAHTQLCPSAVSQPRSIWQFCSSHKAVSHCRMTTQKRLVTLWAPQHSQCSRAQLRSPRGASVLVGTSYGLLSLLRLRERTTMM